MSTMLFSQFPSTKRLFFITLWIACSVVPLCAQAATGDSLPFEAVIHGPEQMVMNHAALLTASSNKLNSGTVTYTWFQEGQRKPISTSSEAFFLPTEPGEYTVRLVVQSSNDGETREATTTKTIRAYKRKIALIADDVATNERIDALKKEADGQNIFLSVIHPPSSLVPLIGQSSFTQTINDNYDMLVDADTVIVWTDPPLLGIQSLLRAASSDEARMTATHEQVMLVISTENLSTIGKTVRGPASALQPHALYLTRPEAIDVALQSQHGEEIAQNALKKEIDIVPQGKTYEPLRPWNAFGHLVTAMLRLGIPSQTMIFLLMLPVIATILAFLKQVIGVSTFGLYTPSIIALSFLSLSWGLGLIFLLCIVAASYAARSLMRGWRMLHVAKVALILTAVSMSLILLIGLGAFFTIILSPDTVFILLIMSTLSESLMTTKIEEGWRSALSGIVETIIAALVCVFVVGWAPFQSLMLAYPEILFLTILANIALGRYTGLRLKEYFRFRELFAHMEE